MSQPTPDPDIRSQPTPDPDSPFASFAQPKPSALKQFVERRTQASQHNKAHWQYLGIAYAGTVLTAVAALAIGVGPQFILMGLAFGAVGALVGIPFGWLLGAISWAAMRNRMLRGSGLAGLSLAPVEAEVVRGNQWSKLLVWLTIWAVLGMVVGAALGTAHATAAADRAATEMAVGWSMSGACLGLVLATGVWLWLLRRARLAAAKRKAEAMD
jgi:hypothetical protein